MRTPEYVVFPEIRSDPWECVRGVDQSFGYNASSRPEHFVSRRDLLWWETPAGLEIDLGPRAGPDPRVVALRHVTARRS